MLRRAITAAALAALLLSPQADAYVCKVSRDYSYVSLKWPQRAITYGVRRPGSVTASDQQIVLDAASWAFTKWTEPECTDIRFEFEGIVDATRDDVVQIVFVDEGWTEGNEVLAVTRTTYTTDDGVIRGGVIEVNESPLNTDPENVLRHQYGDTEADGCGQNNRVYDIYSVLTHEVGHLIGLDHTRNYYFHESDPTMVPNINACESHVRTLEQDDIDGLCQIYPKGEPAGACVPLPVTSGTYVTNTPFGCSAAPGAAGRDVSLWGLAVLALMWLRRSKTCPEVRSGS